MMLLEQGAGVVRILDAFWRGSVGTSSALISGTLVRAVPLTVVGVGIAIAFRAGVFNIGGEGQLLAGAIAATLTGLNMDAGPALTVLAALVMAAIAGAAWAGVAALLRARFGVLEVISTIMLNFIAANLVSYLVRGPMQEPTHIYPQTELIAPVARLPRLLPQTRLHAGALIAVIIAIAAWWVMTRTAAGFRLRAAGASASAARTAGRIDVSRVAAMALLTSGAFAGLAGGIEVAGVTFGLYENLSPGYGFSAIAVAILGRLHPLAILGSAFVFAALETGALGMQRDAGVPSVVASAIEAIAILLVVGAGAWSRWMPRRSVGARVSADGAA
ncbi:MAG TPA: ABC transporter permease [Gemmatimonadaceae bacterium]|nr:ABC transporter permease [Gemmatimonadaceae bacterium]